MGLTLPTSGSAGIASPGGQAGGVVIVEVNGTPLDDTFAGGDTAAISVRDSDGTEVGTLDTATAVHTVPYYIAPTEVWFDPADAVVTADPSVLLSSVSYASGTGIWTINLNSNGGGAAKLTFTNGVKWEFPLEDYLGAHLNMGSEWFDVTFRVDYVGGGVSGDNSCVWIGLVGDTTQTVWEGGGVAYTTAPLPIAVDMVAGTGGTADSDIVGGYVIVKARVFAGRWGGVKACAYSSSHVYQTNGWRATDHSSGTADDLRVVVIAGYWLGGSAVACQLQVKLSLISVLAYPIATVQP